MKKRFLNTVTVIGLAVFAFAGFATSDTKKDGGSSSSSSGSSSGSDDGADYTMTAYELYSAYQENEVAADNKYKGKTIEITGKAESITKDLFDNSVVKLTGDGFFSGISCTMESESAAAAVKKGKAITLVCECDGISFMDVQMKDCEVK